MPVIAEGRGNWSESGCSLVEEESNTAVGKYVCECNHLTNFAVLVVSLQIIASCIILW